MLNAALKKRTSSMHALAKRTRVDILNNVPDNQTVAKRKGGAKLKKGGAKGEKEELKGKGGAKWKLQPSVSSTIP